MQRQTNSTRTCVASWPTLTLALGLQPISSRLCLDAGVVNDCTVDIPFGFSNTLTAVALIEEGSYRAKTDGDKMFWLLPHYPATSVSMGMDLETAS